MTSPLTLAVSATVQPMLTMHPSPVTASTGARATHATLQQ
jgi:hypothetical protein